MTVKVCSVHDVAPDTAARFVVDGTAIALVRFGDDFYAIGDRCSHADVSLSEGEVDPGDRHLECWKHGSRFSVETGEPDTLPATRPVPVYAVTVKDGDVWVAVSEASDTGSASASEPDGDGSGAQPQGSAGSS